MPFDVEGYIRDNLSNIKASTGSEVVARCPACDKDGRFYANTETGAHICFKCDFRGKNVAGIIAQIEGLTYERARALMMRRSVTFRRKETPKSLYQKIRALRGAEEPEAPPVDFDLPEEFTPVWKAGKWTVPAYLKERGVKRETAKAWGIGFCHRGRYGGRIVIPVECPNGKSFTARSTDGAEPRYLNPKGADHGRLLCGWNMLKKAGQLTVVEGPLDAVKMWQHGLPSVALMGKVLHAEQFAMICDAYPPSTEIVLMLDPEEVQAPREIGNRLLTRYERVYIAKLPAGVDPGSSTTKQAQDAHGNAKRHKGEIGDGMAELIERAKKTLSGIYQ